jgi:phenylalanyl-tRNA synthetase beta chain
MRFSESWLREWFTDGLKNLSGDALCEQLTNAGLEVDSYESGIIDIQLTPNRGDCASILGIAREVALINQFSPLTVGEKGDSAGAEGEIDSNPSTGKELLIKINTPDACPIYRLCKIDNINPTAKTPTDILQKLAASGINPIHPVVDILNYVMLELGQPLHAFDAAGLELGLIVDKTRGVEEVLLLNDQTIKVQPDTLVIRKTLDQSILALAGIMGAKQHSVTATTKNIILEAAFFTPEAIRGKARNHGLQTDSSYRFERGVDPALSPGAMERAVSLILEHVGGQLVQQYNFSESLSIQQPLITLRRSRLHKLLGIELSCERIEVILKGLHISINSFDKSVETWQVTAPSFRFDLKIEEDLIEEVARIESYDKIPKRLPSLVSYPLAMPRAKQSLIDLKKRLQTRGYHEVLSYSFTDPIWQALLDPTHTPLALSNPISPQLSVMRTTLWASLLPIFLHNQKRQQSRIRLFETGLRFLPEGSGLKQIPTMTGLAWGTALPETASNEKRTLDFYDIKSDVEALLAPHMITFQKKNHPALHPGRSSAIYKEGQIIGYLGAFHPEVEQKLGISNLYGFEIDRNALLEKVLEPIQGISKFPLIRRDLAFLVDRAVQAADMKEAIERCVGELLYEVNLFDVYQGQGIVEAKKSMAFAVVLQGRNRTLLETEVNPLMEQVVKDLEQQFSAVLREG